jgi:DnaJ-class molecular chaperone
MRLVQSAPCSWNLSSCFRQRQQLAPFQGRRWSHQLKYPNIHETNPFDILGIPKVSTYHEVKRRFVELALQHHPDLNANGDSTHFLRFRQAFEMIRESQDGTARLCHPDDDAKGSTWSSDQEFMAWFHEETGHQDVMFRMDVATRKEVIDMARSQSQGGLDRGGMWEMARAMAEQEESLRKKKQDYHQGAIGIESGEEPAPSSRRRRRK